MTLSEKYKYFTESNKNTVKNWYIFTELLQDKSATHPNWKYTSTLTWIKIKPKKTTQGAWSSVASPIRNQNLFPPNCWWVPWKCRDFWLLWICFSGNNTSSQPLFIFWCKISKAKIKLLNLSVHIPKVHEVAYSCSFELLSELICIYVMSGWWLTMLTMCGNR